MKPKFSICGIGRPRSLTVHGKPGQVAALIEALGEGLAFEVLHDEVVNTLGWPRLRPGLYRPARRRRYVRPGRYVGGRRYVLQRKLLVADVVEDADVGVLEVGDGLGFALEALAEFGALGQMRGQRLDGDDTVEARVAGLVDFAHASCADLCEDFVGAEMSAGLQAHNWAKHTRKWRIVNGEWGNEQIPNPKF
jgi:hypothetical protein